MADDDDRNLRRELGVSRRELIMLFERYRVLYRNWIATPDLEWAAPYVAEMARLMDDLSVR